MQKTKMYITFLIVFLAVPFLFSVETPQAQGLGSATQTVVIVANSNGGYIYKNSSTYLTAQQSTTGTVVNNASLKVGQELYTDGLVYAQIHRGFLQFDMASIPWGVTLNSATLSLNVTSDESTTDFNVTIQQGNGVNPHFPLQTGDFNYNSYSGGGGSLSSAGVGAWFNITLNATGLSWLNIGVGNTTSLTLRSQEDIDASPPSFNEYLNFNSADPQLTVTYTENGPYFYDFHGVYDEATGAYLGAVNVTAYFNSSSTLTFQVAGDKTKGFSAVPTYCLYDLSPLNREYWFTPNENATTLYIYNDAATNYVINFLDYTGVLRNYPFVTAKVNVEGIFVVVEKRKADTQNSVTMNLVNGRKYQIEVGDGVTSYVYGDILMTAATAVQLTLRGADFPKETLLMYKYVRIYGLRNFTSPSGISLIYQDTQSLTTSVDISINLQNGTTVYSTSSTAQTFTVTWTSAANATSYFMDVTVHHSVYGDLTWRQIFLGRGVTSAPWTLSWMGSLPFDTAYLLPALIILFAAGCFSVLNAEVGAILLVITAIILSWMGWVPISGGALVAGLFLAILMALIYNKRRVQT